VAYVVYNTGAADNVGDVLATTRYPVEPLGVKLTVAPVVVIPENPIPVGCVAGVTAAGAFTSTGRIAVQVPVL
jgi:hypothetical protein